MKESGDRVKILGDCFRENKNNILVDLEQTDHLWITAPIRSGERHLTRILAFVLTYKRFWMRFIASCMGS